MPVWLAILAALLVIYFLLHPSHDGYQWYLNLRRPSWFDFEQHIPLIWLGLYVCFFSAARLVLEPQWRWSQAIAFLLLVAMAQGTSWIVCATRSLLAGVVLGCLAWLWTLGMILVLLNGSAAAAALLVPYLLWGPLPIVGRHQMRALNPNAGRRATGGDGRRFR